MSQDMKEEKVVEDVKQIDKEVKEEKEKIEVKEEKEVKDQPEKDKEKVIKEIISPFVTEDDLFNVTVQYYRDGKKMVVQNVDDDFNKTKDCAFIELKIKYPSQGDCDIIAEQGKVNSDIVLDQLNIREFMKLEFVRFLCLVRKWSLDLELNNTNIMTLHPSIIRAILYDVREELAMDGIL